jgi:hypothetical protein
MFQSNNAIEITSPIKYSKKKHVIIMSKETANFAGGDKRYSIPLIIVVYNKNQRYIIFLVN